jgi:hypothetical protein
MRVIASSVICSTSGRSSASRRGCDTCGAKLRRIRMCSGPSSWLKPVTGDSGPPNASSTWAA